MVSNWIYSGTPVIIQLEEFDMIRPEESPSVLEATTGFMTRIQNARDVLKHLFDPRVDVVGLAESEFKAGVGRQVKVDYLLTGISELLARNEQCPTIEAIPEQFFALRRILLVPEDGIGDNEFEILSDLRLVLLGNKNYLGFTILKIFSFYEVALSGNIVMARELSLGLSSDRQLVLSPMMKELVNLGKKREQGDDSIVFAYSKQLFTWMLEQEADIQENQSEEITADLNATQLSLHYGVKEPARERLPLARACLEAEEAIAERITIENQDESEDTRALLLIKEKVRNFISFGRADEAVSLILKSQELLASVSLASVVSPMRLNESFVRLMSDDLYLADVFVSQILDPTVSNILFNPEERERQISLWTERQGIVERAMFNLVINQSFAIFESAAHLSPKFSHMHLALASRKETLIGAKKLFTLQDFREFGIITELMRTMRGRQYGNTLRGEMPNMRNLVRDYQTELRPIIGDEMMLKFS